MGMWLLLQETVGRFQEGLWLFPVEKQNGTLYMTSNGFGSVAVAESKEDPNLWHQRLGHISSKGLKVM